jgi:hypothetical protein
MSTYFLFINEDEISFPDRSKRTLTSVRRHVRLKGSRAVEQQKQRQLQMRASPPIALQSSKSNSIDSFTPQKNAKPIEKAKDKFHEGPIKLPPRLASRPVFEISSRIWQLYPDVHKLIVFYLSGECSQAHLSLHCSSQWSTMIVGKALESERHILFLLCYISSMRSYLNNSVKKGGTLAALEGLTDILEQPVSSVLTSNSSIPPGCSYVSQLTHLTHQAVSTLKACLSTELNSSPPTPLSDFLFPVWCLSRAAILQGDDFAADAHERFIRHLLSIADGAKGVAPWLLRVIIEVDLKFGNGELKNDAEGKGDSELIIESEMKERKEYFEVSGNKNQF